MLRALRQHGSTATKGRATIDIDPTSNDTANAKSYGLHYAPRFDPDLAPRQWMQGRDLAPGQTLSNASRHALIHPIGYAHSYTNTHSYSYTDSHSYLDSYSNHRATGSVA
jgi:hypothetical protein